MKSNYEEAFIEIVELDAADILTDSGSTVIPPCDTETPIIPIG